MHGLAYRLQHWQQKCLSPVLARTKRGVAYAFNTHPNQTGETYLQHLWFTVRMSARMIYAACVLMLHGCFPFLMVRTASSQIERIYQIMRSRIPTPRRSELDE